MDFFLDKLKSYSQLCIPILLGVSAFILITGGKIVWPTNINWFFLHGDNTTSFDAWQFFRHTPIFQNPLGAIYPYGMGMGGSIIYSEPLFIFAFPFKLISSFLPNPFQYSGLWILLCFILQAIFSWELLEKITPDRWLKLFGSLFFILAPAFLWPLHGSSSFLGQWLILAGIWLCLSLGYRRYGWLNLLIMASLVHAYFLLMLLAIWVGDLFKRIFLHELTYLKIIKYFFLNIAVLILGILEISKFLELDKKKYLVVLKKIFPLLTVSFLLMIFALSNRIALGQHELLSYRLPKFFCVFRASGRMVLPMYYLIYLGVFYLVIEAYKKLNTKLQIFIWLCLQTADSSNIYAQFKDYFTPQNSYISPLKSTVWKEAANKYKNLVYLFPEYFWNILPLVGYSALNRINANIGYFARIDFKKANKIKVKMMANLISGKLDEDTMYATPVN